MKIAINFKDNDFSNCFLGVMRTLVDAFKHTAVLPKDKQILCDIINDLSSSCYLLYQHDTFFENTKEHIKRNINDISFDEEVDELISESTSHNSTIIVYDTELDFVGSESIYFI